MIIDLSTSHFKSCGMTVHDHNLLLRDHKASNCQTDFGHIICNYSCELDVFSDFFMFEPTPDILVGGPIWLL